MIRGLVDFALNNRWLVLGLAIMLFAWGIVSFHNLPVEAYPDVANNYVQIITQWPGRAAEEVEQQVTIPLEIQMAGIPHMTHLRSTSLAGLSSLTLIFDDDSVNDWNREKVLERSRRSRFPPACSRRSAPTGVPSARSTGTRCAAPTPLYDNMDLKSLEDWTLEKQFKSVPGVVDVSSFGGITREYQVRVDPDKLVAYGLSIGQVEQQLANNNHQCRRQLHRAGPAADQRPRGRSLHETSTISRRPFSRRSPAPPFGSKISLPSSRVRRFVSARSAKHAALAHARSRIRQLLERHRPLH